MDNKELQNNLRFLIDKYIYSKETKNLAVEYISNLKENDWPDIKWILSEINKTDKISEDDKKLIKIIALDFL